MTPPTRTSRRPVRRVGAEALLPVTAVLVDALHGGDLAPWLVADPDLRAVIYPGYLGMLAEPLLTHGHADMIGFDAVAVWAHVADEPPPEPDDYARRLAEICGGQAGRIADLDAAMTRHHPRGRPHAYLAFLAVVPGAQRQGLGSALLDHAHAQLDEAGTAAYLEATGEQNRRLYLRHGYEDFGEPFAAGPGGPHLYPMWRNPRPLSRFVHPAKPGQAVAVWRASPAGWCAESCTPPQKSGTPPASPLTPI